MGNPDKHAHSRTPDSIASSRSGHRRTGAWWSANAGSL